MDLVSIAVFSLFGAAAIGGLAGVAIGRMSRFEIGLGIGLVIVGSVALWCAARCLLEYRAFAHAGVNALWGEVVAREAAVGRVG